MDNEVKDLATEEIDNTEEKGAAATEGTTKPHKLGAFKKGLIIYSAALLVLCIAALVTLWAFLDSFQKSKSDYTAEQFVDSLSKNDWLDYLSSSIYISEYESKDTALQCAYERLVDGKELHCAKNAAESNNDTNVYYITNGEQRIAALKLCKTGSGAFGFDRWGNEKLISLGDAADRFNPYVSVTLPEGAVLTVNGVKAVFTAENTTDCKVDGTTDAFVRYSFRKPWGEYELSASYLGTALSCTENSLYTLPEEMLTVYRISVPAGAEVYFDTLRLSTEYITESQTAYPFISPLDCANPNAPKSTLYTVTSALSDCEVTAVYDDKTLELTRSEDGTLLFALPYETLTYAVTVPADVTVTVNGTDVSGNTDYIQSDSALYPAVEKYADILSLPKLLVRYEFSGLLFVPEIKVTDIDGNDCVLEAVSATEFSCTAPPAQENISDYDTMAKQFCAAMMDYMFLGRDSLNETMNTALGYTKADSLANKAIVDAYWGMYWRYRYSYVYNSLYVDNYIAYADNAFGCDIHYDITATRESNGKVENVVGVYRILYIRTGATWEIVEFSLMSEE